MAILAPERFGSANTVISLTHLILPNGQQRHCQHRSQFHIAAMMNGDAKKAVDNHNNIHKLARESNPGFQQGGNRKNKKNTRRERPYSTKHTAKVVTTKRDISFFKLSF
jgi:hypothetical protein